MPSRHGCVKPGKGKGPEVAKCEPPMQMRKGRCVQPKGPEVAKCEPPMQMRKGRCVQPKGPEVAKCEHGHGPGCEPEGHEPDKTVSCDRPYIKVGKGCACPPGLIERNHDCKPPTIVVVPPPVLVPVPAGPVPEGPPHVVPAGPAPEGPPPAAPPPPPQQASPLPPTPTPIQSLAKVLPAANRCLPDDLYDLLEQTYGKRPALDRCPSACLPKPASFTPAELDGAAAKSGINWCDNCVQIGGYMPLASVLQLEKAANVTLCVNPDMCRLPAGIGGGDRGGDRVVEIRTVFKDLPAGRKNESNIAVVVGNQDYQGDLPANPDGKADADAVMALLVDQLGYKQENIIDLRDATLSDFERVFGSDTNPEGEFAKRIDKKDPATSSYMSQVTA